ncbi:MAG: ribulose-phosphate 3-epimerase [Candidatus Parcubacteria bacterium]|jgi:ribulose-phosphate 3-epimerase|nr:ribulose-phosphate 3-epimerase [Candidatus Parcubacteria bacterium]
MVAIIPAILPTSREDLDARLNRLHGITERVQIDVVDGRFVTPASWPYAQKVDVQKLTEDSLPELGSFRFEIDLMAEEPEKSIGPWIRAGATRITVHAETTRRLPDLIRDFQVTYGHDKGFAPGLIAFGLAINLATDTSLIEPYLDQCDYVQFMGIARIGKQGEPFAPAVLPKIHAFHRKYPDMLIQVDGGVSRETAPRLLAAGASRLIVGSDLWNAPNLGREMKELCDIAETRGLYT